MNDSVKQRLIGAIVLLIICASIWPIVFPPAEKPTTVIESLIPPPPALEIFEIPEQAEPTPITSVVEMLEESRGQLTVDKVDKPLDTSALDTYQERDALPTAENVAAEVESAIKTDGAGWAIQMGAFSSYPNAEKLADELRAKNYSVVVQRRSHKGQQLAFVFLGPYLLKSQADAIRAELAAAGTDARVVEFHL